jgi:DNA-binding NtrC family response regulator
LGAGEEISQDEVEQAVRGRDVSEMVDAGGLFSFDQPLRQAREQFEKFYLEYQLAKHSGNVSKTAAEAEMERTHLYRKLKSLGIEIKDKK